jgi:hypothetical protein
MTFHASGGPTDLIVQAGSDSLRAVGTLVETEPIFIWALLPAGRAALGAFAFARWLAECPLDRDTRVLDLVDHLAHILGGQDLAGSNMSEDFPSFSTLHGVRP